jgi:CMP-N-acetylneuraminic acid synthetase
MKAIIPAKDSSKRLPNKNFLKFYDGQSLVDITVQKLLRVLKPNDIYISCENPAREEIALKWGVNFLLREKILTDNNTNFYHVFNGVCDQISGDDDIAWCGVTDPLFDEHENCFNKWNSRDLSANNDSLVAVYPFKDYILDSKHEPVGFKFGRWHLPSQKMNQMYRMTFVLSILTRSCIKDCGYWIGTNPIWHYPKNSSLDIDTRKDFEFAQHLYTEHIKRQKIAAPIDFYG